MGGSVKHKRRVGRPRKPLPNNLQGRVAYNVRRLRERRSRAISVEDAAREVGISAATWWRIEGGQHPGLSIQTIESIAVVLEVDPAELFKRP